MKVMIFGVSAAALVGGWFLLSPYTPPNVYPVAPAEAYARLMRPTADQQGEGWIDRPNVRASGNGSSEITWALGQGGAYCTILVAPYSGDRSEINMTCPNIGEAAAAGLATNMRRNLLIELADATMTGRPFDKQRAQGATAGKWPADTVEHGNIFDASSQAIQMDADMRRQEAQWRKEEAARPKPKPPGW